MNNTATKKNVRKPRKKLNSYRVWFKGGDSAVILAEYPNQVYDLLPPEMSMKVENIVDNIE